MKKIVNPCVCDTYYGKAHAYAKIKYENGRLSIRGIVGPKRNGDCMGSAGQCVDAIRSGKPTEDWTNEMLQKFCDIWDEWHFNDMHPYCNHMKELGWAEQAQEKVKVMKWDRSKETMYANVGYGVTRYNDELPEHPEFYEFKEKDCLGRSNTEYKMRGQISYSEHPLGFIGRSCPVCGYKYGTSWIKEEVPQNVIEWLFSLPKSETQPAWV